MDYDKVTSEHQAVLLDARLGEMEQMHFARSLDVAVNQAMVESAETAESQRGTSATEVESGTRNMAAIEAGILRLRELRARYPAVTTPKRVPSGPGSPEHEAAVAELERREREARAGLDGRERELAEREQALAEREQTIAAREEAAG